MCNMSVNCFTALMLSRSQYCPVTCIVVSSKSLDHGNYKSHFHSCLINRTAHRDSFPVFAWKVTLDYQLIVIPAYNRDRGPISVLGFHVHTAEFERLAVRKCRSFRFGTLP